MPAIATILDVEPFGARAAPGTGTAFLVLGAFVVSFLLIRTSARLTRSVAWWPGGVQTGSGVHVHHLVWGICLMMLAGFLGFAVPVPGAARAPKGSTSRIVAMGGMGRSGA